MEKTNFSVVAILKFTFILHYKHYAASYRQRISCAHITFYSMTMTKKYFRMYPINYFVGVEGIPMLESAWGDHR